MAAASILGKVLAVPTSESFVTVCSQSNGGGIHLKYKTGVKNPDTIAQVVDRGYPLLGKGLVILSYPLDCLGYIGLHEVCQ